MGSSCAHHVAQFPDFPVEHVVVEKQPAQAGTQRLVLSRGADALPDRQISQKRIDFRFRHFCRMPQFVKVNEVLHPVRIGLSGSAAVVARLKRVPQTFKQLRFGRAIRDLVVMVISGSHDA